MEEANQPTQNASNAGGMSKHTLLALSVIASALILSGTLFVVGNDLGSKITGLSVALPAERPTGTGSDPVGTGNTGTVANAPQPGPVINFKELAANASGTLGNADAKIALIEYSDYQCPFCRKFKNESLKKIEEKFVANGTVTVIHKDYTLDFHPMAPVYAVAARCAGEQGKYWGMAEIIYAEQTKKGQGTITDFTAEDVKTWAQTIGLNAEQFNACLESGKFDSQIQANEQEGASIGISGTPGFYVGLLSATGKIADAQCLNQPGGICEVVSSSGQKVGYYVSGAHPYTVFDQLITELAQAA